MTVEGNIFPSECRQCRSNKRMKGNFMCPECHPDIDADEYDGEYA